MFNYYFCTTKILFSSNNLFYSYQSRAKEALKKILPNPLKEADQEIITDETVKKWHIQLLQTLAPFEQVPNNSNPTSTTNM